MDHDNPTHDPSQAHVTPAGWYPAEGDPPGTVRRWNGTEWIGFPVRDPSIPMSPPTTSNTSSYDHDVSRWGIPDFLICSLLFFGLSIAFAILAAAVTDPNQTLPGVWLPLAVAVGPIAELLYVHWVGRRKGRGIELDFGFRYRKGDFGIGATLFLAAMVTGAIIAAIWVAIAGEPPSAAAIDIAEESGEDGGLTIWIILFALIGAILVPIVEELVFRGLLWSALEKRGLSPNWTLAITSVVFAGFHLELARTPVLLAIGVLLGLGRRRTGRIAPSIIAHMIINSLGMIALVVEFAS